MYLIDHTQDATGHAFCVGCAHPSHWKPATLSAADLIDLGF